ncbi:MAG: EAL domain-containing protein [Epsilonproteobacteria bacterium]|nr:EAL domain-containing protein [Campylobacterota bacterium]
MSMEKRLSFYIFLIPVFGLIMAIIIGIYLIDYAGNLSAKEGVKFLQKRELYLQKEKLRILVDGVVRDIDILHKENKPFIPYLQKAYPPYKDQYIFIYKVYNLKGGDKFAKLILNTNRPDLIGKLLNSSYKDAHGFAFRDKMLELIRQNGYAFVQYYYKKPHSNQIAPKISYFKYYKPLNLIVASGIYLDDIENIINAYKTHIEDVNSFIIHRLMIISFIVAFILMFFVYLISLKLSKEFMKFRNSLRMNEKKLRYKLYVDEITKLKSRKALIEDIEKQKFDSLILIDIDGFGNINQFFGAHIGDQYLMEFGHLLKQFKKIVKKSFLIYRIGADEFVLGVKNASYDETKLIVYKLYDFLSKQKIYIDNEEFDVDVTVVFSDMPSPLKKALITLTEAKANNLSILSYADIKDKDREKKLFKIKRLLKYAIEHDQITPFAQPIVDSEKQVIKYELLMRIVTPQEVIPPYFLEYAKKLKLYNTISKMMINKCFEFIHTTDILCSINVDMQDITNEEVVEELRKHVKDLDKPVVFEILESESFKDFKALKAFIEEFKRYNVLFAIDDFGSGYSNYSEILALKPDYLKLDGSLIKNIISSKESLVLVQSILYFTQMLGIKTTAEFVENEEIFNRLRAIGVNEFQGYFFDKPRPLDELKGS